MRGFRFKRTIKIYIMFMLVLLLASSTLSSDDINIMDSSRTPVYMENIADIGPTIEGRLVKLKRFFVSPSDTP